MITSACISGLLQVIKDNSSNHLLSICELIIKQLDNEMVSYEKQLESQKEICVKIIQIKKQIEKSKENIKRLEKEIGVDMIDSNIQYNLAEIIKENRITIEDISDSCNMQNICANTTLFEATKEFLLQNIKIEETKFLKYTQHNS